MACSVALIWHWRHLRFVNIIVLTLVLNCTFTNMEKKLFHIFFSLSFTLTLSSSLPGLFFLLELLNWSVFVYSSLSRRCARTRQPPQWRTLRPCGPKDPCFRLRFWPLLPFAVGDTAARTDGPPVLPELPGLPGLDSPHSGGAQLWHAEGDRGHPLGVNQGRSFKVVLWTRAASPFWCAAVNANSSPYMKCVSMDGWKNCNFLDKVRRTIT